MADLQNLLDDSHDSSVLGAIAHPAQVNVLGAYGAAADTAGKIYGIQDMQAQKAWGNALQQSVGPDGTVDYDKARTIAAADPLATMGMMKGLSGSAELARSQQTQGANANGLMVNAISAALKGDDAGLHDRVAAGMQQLIDAGAVPRGRGMTALTRLPNDPAALRAHLEQQRISLLPPEMQQAGIYGTRPQISTGGGTEFPVVPPISTGQSGPSVPNTLSPGEKVQTQPAISSGGQKGNVPVGSRYDERGNLKPPGWGLNGGKYAPPGATPGQPAPAQTSQNGPAGFQPTEQPPGAEAATAAGNAIYTQADQANAQKSQLLTMESDLQGISTGPVSERKQQLDAFTAQLGIRPITATPDELAKGEAFAKVAKQIALAQAGSLGVGTDEKLTVAMGANPSLNLSKMGNKQIIAMLQGNADAIRARGVAYDAWLKQGNNPAQANQFITQFNRSFDPRVYQWQYQIKDMTDAERQAAFDKLPDKAAFRAKYNDAVKQGLIQPQ